ncbi:hypothetical protein OIO90_003642 [Microbotryomycetes sp. JL221]|nr:hypothetical protein OIO90_003642 [Microbotryomycetes sp. JL221]
MTLVCRSTGGRGLRWMLTTPCHARRPLSSSSSRFEPVELAADEYNPSSSSSSSHHDDTKRQQSPIVILHGLYGSKSNWRSMAKAMAQQLNTHVHALDLRNHGTSPHAKQVTYRDLANDVAHYIDKHELKDVTLLGHSMGGKVAMSLALEPHEAIQRLVVVDIAPGSGKISPEFKTYLETMKQINNEKVTSRKQADEILQKVEPDFGVRAFLLTNLELDEQSNSKTFKFRLPLDYFENAIEEIGLFPFEPSTRTFDKPTLFIKGEKSKYINKRNIPLCQEYFPNSKISVLPTGHWVHAEKPKEFIQELANFLQ